MKKELLNTLRKIGLYTPAKKMQKSFALFVLHIMQKSFSNGMILLYHRVAEVTEDPHNLAVTPENFKKQLMYLKQNYTIVPLHELVSDLKSKKIKNKTIAITFDDGYEDNLHNALPILEELSVPATVFVTTGKIGSKEAFYEHEDSPLEDQGKSLSREELLSLAKSPLVEIGAHSVNHPNLAKLSPEVQYKEISESKHVLEQILQKPIISFAYPYGSSDSFSKETIAAVQKAGFEYACANTRKRVFSSSHLFAIPRIVVRNWDIDALKKYLENV